MTFEKAFEETYKETMLELLAAQAAGRSDRADCKGEAITVLNELAKRAGIQAEDQLKWYKEAQVTFDTAQAFYKTGAF